MSEPVGSHAFKMLQDLMAQGFANLTTSVDELKAEVRSELARGRERMDAHGRRLDALETWRAGLEGERRGVAMSVKIVWGLVGGAVMAAFGAALKISGVL